MSASYQKNVSNNSRISIDNLQVSNGISSQGKSIINDLTITGTFQANVTTKHLIILKLREHQQVVHRIAIHQ